MADEGLFGGGAAFGVFPQMGGRRRLQDPQASADVPVQVLRGRLAGLLGLPADIGNIVRSPMPMEMFGDYEYEKPPQLPYTTEYFLKELPLAPTAPVGQLAGQVGSFVPLSPMPAVRGAQTVGRMVGQRMAENVAMGRPSLPSMLAEPRASLFAVEPSPMMPKPQAQVSELGFYSAAEQAAMNLPRNKGTGQSFLNDLMKAPDVKKDELAWTGLDDFLANKPNVTKQEVQDFIANNRVDVQERQLSGRGDKSGVFSEFNPDKNQFMVYGEDLSQTHAFNTAEEADNFVKQFNSQIPYGPSKYDKYQLPGGENYREILLTLPDKKNQFPDFEQWITNRYGGSQVPEGVRQAARKEYERQSVGLGISSGYQSSHFNEPNILAHIRVNDRVDADGKKMLLIEEIQSDWHQAGREKGYKGQFKDLPNDYKIESKTDKDGYSYYEVLDPQGNVFAKDYSKGSVTNQAINRLNETVGGVPDAPFKDTWYQLALKRVLKHAADNGYERVGLTTGKQQAERFDLSKQVDELLYKKNEDGTYQLSAQAGGRGNMMGEAIPENKLSDYVGKEVASKITDNVGKDMNLGPNNRPKDMWKSLSDVDLQVGGEGMKKYYDEIYPKFLDKYGKKWNARVGETRIKTGQGIPGGAPVRYIDITPEMKGAVSKGQPLFAAVPVGSIGLGYQKDKADNLEETSPMYSDPFGNTIGSSIR